MGGTLTLQNTNVGMWTSRAIKTPIKKVMQNTVNTKIVSRCGNLNTFVTSFCFKLPGTVINCVVVVFTFGLPYENIRLLRNF